MRLIIVFVMFCLFNDVSAQNIGDNKVDTPKETSWLELNKKYNSPLFVLDGSPLDSPLTNPKLINLDPHNILDISILKYVAMKDVYVNNGGRDCVIIETKINAKKRYQKKLGTFSKQYKSYLDTHQDKDDDLIYILNGKPVERKIEGEMIKELFAIPIKKIEKVDFIGKYYKEILNNNKPVVLIITKL